MTVSENASRSELTNTAKEIWVSPVSTREIGVLNTRGRTHEIAQLASQLSLHRDPADRFLVATSQIMDFVLVMADEKLLGLGTIRSLANR